MIVDITNTIGRHLVKPEIHAGDLVRQMDQAGVDKAVVHTYAESLDNDSVAQAILDYPDRLIGLYTIHPWFPPQAEDFVNAVRKQGFRGLYMDPIRQGFSLGERAVFYPWLELAEKLEVPLMCMSAAEVFSSPVFFAQMAENFPRLNIIMERMGLQYDNASAVQIVKKYSNVYTETSASMDFNAIRTIKAAGAHKVLLGSGTPHAGVFELEIKKVINATKDIPGGQEQVLYKNALKLFKINEG